VKALTVTTLIVLLLAAAGCGPQPQSNPVAQQAATEAAEKWLAMMDEGQYVESWDGVSEYLQAIIPKERWHESIAPARAIMGKLVSRTVQSSQYSEVMPGLPDGKYVVIQYETVFEKKKAAIENVAVSQEDDGVWRVSGYFIR